MVIIVASRWLKAEKVAIDYISSVTEENDASESKKY